MADTTSIDSLIRAKAREQAKADVAAALRALPSLPWGEQSRKLSKPGSAAKLYLSEALNIIEEEIIAAITPKYENEAIEGFLNRFEDVSKQMDYIRDNSQTEG